MRKITILIDNHVRQRGLLAEHGLSLWVEWNDHSLDFITKVAKSLGRKVHIEIG